MDVMKAEGEETFSTMTSERITVGVTKEKKMQILVVGILGTVCTLQVRILFSDQ